MSLSFPVLLTPRLKLRQITPSDADALFAIHSDVDAMRWYGVDPITERAQAETLAEAFAGWFVARTGCRWGLERHDDQRLIGSCGFFRWNRSWRNCMVGYELARDCQGQGYMREAMAAILDYGFDELQLHRVQAECHPGNPASIRLLAKLGFRFEGTHRGQAYWEERFHDLNCYALLAQEWQAQSGFPGQAGVP